MKKVTLGALLFATILGSGSLSAKASSRSSDNTADFSVDFTDCVESIGVTLVPTEKARAKVPSQFVLAGEGSL